MFLEDVIVFLVRELYTVIPLRIPNRLLQGPIRGGQIGYLGKLG